MNVRYVVGVSMAVLVVAFSAFGQSRVVINDPTVTAEASKWSAADEALINSAALPRITAKYEKEPCNVNLEPTGVIFGSFTKPNAKQTLAYFQICQTGNGLGMIGLVLIENGKVIGTFASDGGWSDDISLVPDINKNGLDEFTLAYSGGLHQGQGGIGVDLVEFTGGKLVGIGWYLAEKFEDTDAVTVWKLTAKPGPKPVFYKQRYDAKEKGKWRKVGADTVAKLGKAYSKFTVVK
ncbi:hypothetical protein BH10ACI3_BH10ACI3_29570 [soil metagenome]